MTSFALAPALDAAVLAPLYARQRRLQITNFLTVDSAKHLLAWLAGNEDWRLAVNQGETIRDFGPAMLAKFTAEHWAKLDKAVALGGRYGFQFRYETIRLPKDGPGSGPLAEFADFLSSPDILTFMRTLTGADDIEFADAHASRYRPGHFLTAHDDRADGMGRRAAYVLNLTPEWRPDWGGLLLFHDEQGNITRGFTPAFNSLNIFAVPQAHSVSWVTPLAGAPRYAVTGWLRAGETD